MFCLRAAVIYFIYRGLGRCCRETPCSLHAFADDTQLYLHCRREDTASTAVRLEHCLLEIGHWMSSNQLKLNADKSELL